MLNTSFNGKYVNKTKLNLKLNKLKLKFQRALDRASYLPKSQGLKEKKTGLKIDTFELSCTAG
jgi:hypothetical protein